jgi:hypothetical protein
VLRESGFLLKGYKKPLVPPPATGNTLLDFHQLLCLFVRFMYTYEAMASLPLVSALLRITEYQPSLHVHARDNNQYHLGHVMWTHFTDGKAG